MKNKKIKFTVDPHAPKPSETMEPGNMMKEMKAITVFCKEMAKIGFIVESVGSCAGNNADELSFAA